MGVTWEVHLCLQCPFSAQVYRLLPELKAAFPTYDIKIVLTALPFHLNGWAAMCMAHVEGVDRQAYVKACFDNQDKFSNRATKGLTSDQIFTIFADFVEDKSGKSQEQLVKEALRIATSSTSAWQEFKHGIEAGVIGVPKHVIDGVVMKTDSSWKVEDYEAMIAARESS